MDKNECTFCEVVIFEMRGRVKEVELRMAQNEDERELLMAAANMDMQSLVLLLQRGVCPDVHNNVRNFLHHEIEKEIEGERGRISRKWEREDRG